MCYNIYLLHPSSSDLHPYWVGVLGGEDRQGEEMDAADKINDLIDQSIQSLIDDDINQGADALMELAQTFAKAGAGLGNFENIRQYIIQEAEKKTSTRFIAEKLKLIERERHNGRKIVGHSGNYKH